MQNELILEFIRIVENFFYYLVIFDPNRITKKFMQNDLAKGKQHETGFTFFVFPNKHSRRKFLFSLVIELSKTVQL